MHVESNKVGNASIYLFCRATARDVGLFVASIAFVWFLDKEVFNYVPPPES